MDGTAVIHLDTHVLVRLFLGEVEALSAAAREAIESHDLVASPAAVLELEYLHEIGRLRVVAADVVAELAADVDLRICGLPFRTVAEQALKESWTRDPFDRLIVANAKVAGAALLTKDERIRHNYARAQW